MTKQEEIREGIERIIKSNCLGVLEGEVRGASGNIMFYLDSQGVVVKRLIFVPLLTEGEIELAVENADGDGATNICLYQADKMLKAGYVAVEPLVKT